MATLKDAIALLEQGDWQAAHRIVQRDGSTAGSWAHGIVHLMEGDLGNANYWYRKAKRKPVQPDQIQDEIRALKQSLRST